MVVNYWTGPLRMLQKSEFLALRLVYIFSGSGNAREYVPETYINAWIMHKCTDYAFMHDP
jgi:hypothetical protein